MRLPKFKSPTTAVVIGLGVSGIVIGGVGYYIFKHHQSIVDDTDEGIGDEDSIVSEDEVERSVPLQRLASYLPENVISSDTSVTSTANHITPSDLAVTSIPSVTESNTPMTSLDMHITSSALSDLQDFDDNFNATETELLETPVQSKPLVPAKVLVLGLEGCGKSYLLNILAKTPNTGYTPTIGFNVVQIETDGYMLNVMEVGGGAKTRKYWSEFTSDMDLLIYMVDAGQLARFKPAKLELVQLLQQT
uniref:Uncharacterized protein n=1 Tax=Ciona savignyi TaxID=51511 RepID=H2YBV5_CIOSA